MATQHPHPRTGYHHGDLRTALLKAARLELADKGVEGFTLRGCARRAMVSHAAPAHHFRDADALLTALAAEGFRAFLAAMQAGRQAQAGARAELTGAGLGYVRFALAEPALFQLMFSSSRPDFDDPDLRQAASAAFEDLVANVGRIRGDNPRASTAGLTDVAAAWSIVHGLAALLLGQRMAFLNNLPPDERDDVLAAIIARTFPLREG
ncbi:MAG: WHG domain-containing protein [Rhizobiaceae bacterium]|nr:WHG domain-containing protein [Rhizobiaceae bacterium]